jgi:hypothetical protein
MNTNDFSMLFKGLLNIGYIKYEFLVRRLEDLKANADDERVEGIPSISLRGSNDLILRLAVL